MPDPYGVRLSDTARKSLRRFPRVDQQRIVTRIEQLAMDPFSMPNVKHLVDYDISYRLRVGNYRILFERDDTIRMIDVIDVRPRGRAYER